jgi:hypothetical protein
MLWLAGRYIALQCPDSADPTVRSIIMAETHLVEVVDAAGILAPGQIGRVLVTDLHNFATPLIRYDIGDYSRGRRALRLRARLAHHRADCGANATSSAVPMDAALAAGRFLASAVAPVRQYQLVQHALADRGPLVVDRPPDDGEEQLGAVITAALGAEFALTFRYFPDRIPTGPNGNSTNSLSALASGPSGLASPAHRFRAPPPHRPAPTASVRASRAWGSGRSGCAPAIAAASRPIRASIACRPSAPPRCPGRRYNTPGSAQSSSAVSHSWSWNSRTIAVHRSAAARSAPPK